MRQAKEDTIKRLAFEPYILDFLKERSVSVDAILRQLDHKADNRLERLRLLAGFAIEACDEPRLGLLIGQRASTMSYGILGHALAHCRNLLESQKLMQKHIWVLQPLPKNALQLELSETQLIMCYRFPPSWPEIPDFFSDLFYSANLKRARELTGRPLSETRLELQRPLPADGHRYHEILNVNVRFGAAENRLIFARREAERPFSASFITQSNAYMQQCDQMLRQMQNSSGLTEQIRRLIMEDREHSLTMQSLADHLNMEIRTLRRHLRKEGTTFRQIQQDVRCHLACNYLTNTTLSVADIAGLIGYHDTPTFNRAFKAWIGKTPPSYRLQNNKLE